MDGASQYNPIAKNEAGTLPPKKVPKRKNLPDTEKTGDL